MNNLYEYVTKHGECGACKCGKCIDAPENPEELQPPVATSVDLTLFRVTINELEADRKALAEELIELVKEEAPELLDGHEHNYIELGAKMGDQQAALLLIGVGHLLGVWKALSPSILLPGLPDDLKMEMAQRGMVSLQAMAPAEEKLELKPLTVRMKETGYINWLTYAHDKDGVGLGMFLAQVSKCQSREVELLESPNDTDYKVSVTKQDLKKDGIYEMFDDEKITKKLDSGGIEYDHMHGIFCWMLKRGYIPEGDYIVTMSW